MITFDEIPVDDYAVLAELCKDDLLYFTRFWFKVLRGQKFILNWHHEAICKELEKTANYEYELLNINIPPRHSKTELAGINFIAWSLAKNPRANFLYITASDELRSETSIRIRDIITHPLYALMFGVEIKKDQSGKNLWRTKQGGGLKTATIFGQITGFGAGRMVEKDLINYINEFEGAIILDDINKIIDSQSNNANNKKSVDTIFTTILSRKNSKETPIINIQQRTGENDATAALLDYFDDSETKSIIFPVLMEGVPLWEFKLGMKGITKLKQSVRTSHIFETQYMQNPQPLEGLIFPKQELIYYSPEEIQNKSDGKWIIIDPADKGKDYYAAVLVNFIGVFCYLEDVIYDNRTFEYTEPKTIAMAKNGKADRIFLETNKEGTAFKRTLQKRLKGIQIKGIHNSTNKLMRIKNNAHFIKKYMRFRKDYEVDSEYDLFMSDVFSILQDGSNNDHDDAPDCLATFAKQSIRAYPNLYL